jgi:hypothetical protein
LFLVNLFVIGSNKSYILEGLENKDTKNVKEPVTTLNKEKKPSLRDTNLPITPLDNVEDNVQSASTESNVDESFEVGRAKKNSQGYNIDYASTVEDAYDELNKILGSDGIKRLTSDTQNLMKQQLQLAESMKSMEPLIAGMAPIMQQAQGLLQGMGGDSNLGNLANIAKKFTAGLENKAN